MTSITFPKGATHLYLGIVGGAIDWKDISRENSPNTCVHSRVLIVILKLFKLRRLKLSIPPLDQHEAGARRSLPVSCIQLPLRPSSS